MAGTILIDQSGGVALSGFGYLRIIDGVREHLDAKSRIATRSIFEPNDEEGMSFISLVEATPAAFQAFHDAATAAYSAAVEAGQSFPEWDELMTRLSRDERRSAV